MLTFEHCWNNSFLRCGWGTNPFQVARQTVKYVDSEETGTYSGPVKTSWREGISGPLMRNQSREVVCDGLECHSDTLEFYPMGNNELSDI